MIHLRNALHHPPVHLAVVSPQEFRVRGVASWRAVQEVEGAVGRDTGCVQEPGHIPLPGVEVDQGVGGELLATGGTLHPVGQPVEGGPRGQEPGGAGQLNPGPGQVIQTRHYRLEELGERSINSSLILCIKENVTLEEVSKGDADEETKIVPISVICTYVYVVV